MQVLHLGRLTCTIGQIFGRITFLPRFYRVRNNLANTRCGDKVDFANTRGAEMCWGCRAWHFASARPGGSFEIHSVIVNVLPAPRPHTSGKYICVAVGGRVRYSPGRLAYTLQASSVASS